MAVFRRGLSDNAASEEKMLRYLSSVTHENNLHAEYRMRGILLIASLFALCKDEADLTSGDMGTHFAAARDRPNASAATQLRFSSLLDAHQDDLPIYLRRAVTFLKAQQVQVHWAQLLDDVWSWSHPDYGEKTRRRWARSFWLGPPNAQVDDGDETTDDEQVEQIESESL
jgi:CRISPR type I-E-associated protein CasB/Cse2